MATPKLNSATDRIRESLIFFRIIKATWSTFSLLTEHKIPYPRVLRIGSARSGQPSHGAGSLFAGDCCVRGEGSSLHSPVCRVAKCRLSVANIFVTHQAKSGCLSLMPRFLPPHIRQCFAVTRRTIIMHYAVNTVIIYVNIKLFKEMRGLKEKY